MARTAVIRADASRTLGGGHVLRCSALADVLRQSGWSVLFAVSDETVATMPALGTSFPVTTGFDNSAQDIPRLRAAMPARPDLILIDHYGIDVAHETRLRELSAKIVAIDDAPNRPHDCDTLIDTTLGRQPGEYAGLVPAHCTLLCGSSFAILRPAFREMRSRVIGMPRRTSDPPKLLISFGLMDHANATGAVVAALLDQAPKVDADIVLGEGAPFAVQVRWMVEHAAGRWSFHSGLGEAGMAGLIASADLVVGAGGTSSYERCCLGKPAALLLIADNQAANVAALTRSGAAIDLGDIATFESQRVRSAIMSLIGDPQQLADMGRAAAQVTDGLGATRIARHLAEM